MSLPRDVEVEIYYLPTADGGRQRAAFTGYRGQFYYEGQDWDAIQTFIETDSVSPGSTVRAYVAFLSPSAHSRRVAPGMPFLIREGRRIVGYGVVERLLDLANSALSESPLE